MPRHKHVRDNRGDYMTDVELLASAEKEAESWAKQVKAGVTRERRKRPATTSRFEPRTEQRSDMGPASWGYSVAFDDFDPDSEPGSLFNRYGR